jgi:hypothetical protein
MNAAGGSNAVPIHEAEKGNAPFDAQRCGAIKTWGWEKRE